MSGQPYRYSTDQAKYRAEYMKNLQERIDLDDMVLQAVKGYVSNGTLPAISQLPDTRTTAEKLMDIQKLKQDMIKDLSPIMDPQIADRIIQGLVQSPLNSDNRLVIFFSQRAPEIVTQLQKIYKYGVKGDANDITTFVEFINNMYLEKNKATASIKSFIDRSGTSGLSMTTKDDLLNLKTTYSNFTVDLLRKLRPTGTESEMINDLGLRLNLLTQYLPSDRQVTRLYEIIKDPSTFSFAFTGPVDDMIDFINTSLPNKKIFYQLVQDFENLARPINEAYGESYKEREGDITRKQYKRMEGRRIESIEASTMDVLQRLSSILPTVETLRTVFTPEILNFLNTEIDPEQPKVSLLNSGVYNQAPYLFKKTPGPVPGPPTDVREDESEGSLTTIRARPGSDPNDPRFRPIVEDLTRTETKYDPTSGETIEPTQRQLSRPSTTTSYIDETKMRSPDENIQDMFSVMTNIADHMNEVEKITRQSSLTSDEKEKIIGSLVKGLKNLLSQMHKIKDNMTDEDWKDFKENNIDEINSINDIVVNIGGDEITGPSDNEIEGFGFKKKRRGRPKGTGFKQNIESHIDTQKGIQPDFRFSKFGKYLIRNDHLMDNKVSIRTGKGMNIMGLPSTATGPRVINIIKKIIGGALPSFDEMSKLTDDEKAYLHKISKKSNILEKVNIPTPSKDKEEKEFNEFEILRGEIMAGNDNKDMVRKFKGFLLKFSKTGQLPKQQVNEILQDMLDMNL